MAESNKVNQKNAAPDFKGGNCIDLDPELCFPSDNDVEGIALAKAMCIGCIVIDECREWSLAQKEQHGVAGGLSADERNQRKAQPKPNAA